MIKALKEKGIPTAIYYPIPLNEQAAYKNCKVVSSGLKKTEMYLKSFFVNLLSIRENEAKKNKYLIKNKLLPYESYLTEDNVEEIIK